MAKMEFCTLFASLMGVIASLTGGWDQVLRVLSVFMAIDYLTGVVSAIRLKTVNSETGFSGLLKKATVFLVIIIATQLDSVVNTSGFFRTSTALFFVSNEAISILENVNEIGVPLPHFLMEALEKLRNKHSHIEAPTLPQEPDGDHADSGANVGSKTEEGGEKR